MLGRILAVGASAGALVLHSSLHRKIDAIATLQTAHIAALTENNGRLEAVELTTQATAKELKDYNATVNTAILGLTAVGALLGAAIAMAAGGRGGPTYPFP